jgi:hypothetical protein
MYCEMERKTRVVVVETCFKALSWHSFGGKTGKKCMYTARALNRIHPEYVPDMLPLEKKAYRFYFMIL